MKPKRRPRRYQRPAGWTPEELTLMTRTSVPSLTWKLYMELEARREEMTERSVN